MNQYPSHSNTPSFDVNKSQTTTRLNQHPTAQEMQNPTAIWINLRDFLIFAVTAVICWLIVSLIITAIFGG